MRKIKTQTNTAQNVEAAPQTSQVKHWLVELFRRAVLFICCGPGVLGFLWLIGRILKR